MARLIFKGCLLAGAVSCATAISPGGCDVSDTAAACSSSAIEAHEEQEIGAATVELLQAHKQKQIQSHAHDQVLLQVHKPKRIQSHAHDQVEDLQGASASNTHGEEHKQNSSAGLVTHDHNGNVCMLCGKPLPERVNKVYTEFRSDCGSLSTPTGPSASTIGMPVAQLTQVDEKGTERNGFCQLNFAKSCVDAVANRDYLYWAKSIDLKASGSRENSAWDGRYCRQNGFLQSDVKALQHDFKATQAKAKELCKTKYSKYNIHNITFKDMMSVANYDDNTAPSLEDAELLAAWNCAMGDLGCDMALCAYSFCEKGQGTGLYDECEGWHPVHGMPAHF